MKKLLKFFSKDDNLGTFLNFIKRGEQISSKKGNTALRTLDWFATNYTKYKRVNIDGIDIQSDYRQQLKAYQKEFFDPFRRKTRILLSWEPDEKTRNFEWRFIDNEKDVNESETCIVTTIGQLNFFKWAIDRNILNFIKDNTESIQDSQNKFSKSKRKNQSKGTIIKNGSISHQTVMKVVVDF